MTTRIKLMIFLMVMMLITLGGIQIVASADDGVIWTRQLTGSKILTLQTIKDMNGDGHEDVFAVSTTANNGSMFLVDGKTGDIIRSSEALGYPPLEALFINEPSVRVAVAYAGGVRIYNYLFDQVHVFPLSYTPSYLNTFTGEEVLFLYSSGGVDNLDCYSLATGSLEWRQSYTNSLGIDFALWQLLVLNSTRVVALFYEYYTLGIKTWAIDVYNNEGTRLQRVDGLGNATYTDRLSLNYYNTTHFLYSHKTSVARFVRLSTVIGINKEECVWSTQVWNEDGNNGFAAVDANQDGAIDVMAVLGGNVAVLNGTDGSSLYTIDDIFASNITDIAILSDVNNDGTSEVVLKTENSYLVQLGKSSYTILWEKQFGSEGIDSIQDVDGDANKEIVAATDTEIVCFLGHELDITPPIANAGADQMVNEDIIVQFNGSGSSDNKGIVSYKWTFTDVTSRTLTGETPAYTFNTPGNYLVTLNVTDAGGNWDTDTVSITVLDITNPSADAGPDQAVLKGTTVTLHGEASTDNVGIASYTWTFTDISPKTLTGANPSYTFNNIGDFQITLNVSDAAGNWDIDTTQVSVSADTISPIANAGQDKTTNVGVTVTFDAGGSTDNLGIVSYEWNFGDGATGTGKTTTHVYANPGIYTSTLTVKDGAGNVASDTLIVTVKSTETGIIPLGPLVWVLGGVAAAVIVATAVILWRRHKHTGPRAEPA